MIKNLSLFIFFIYFLILILTLPDYGINWDTINHLPRGQAFAHFFLTGNKTYSDLTPFHKYYQDPKSLGINTNINLRAEDRRSLYQNDGSDFNWHILDGNGHPPLSDILSSFFNILLFQKLGLINDIDSYRVYGVLLSALLVALVYFWTSKIYGGFAGLISAITLSTYPLFFSEAHFNSEKDIPETFYWSFLLFCIWKGVISKSWRWIILSGVIFGLGLGTKFNILFSSLVILPWLLIYLITIFNQQKKNNYLQILTKNIKLILSLLFAPIIGFIIFVASWPYLWYHGLTGLKTVFGFYKTIGTNGNPDSRFIWHYGINLYPIKWILYTTPPVVIILFVLGIGFVIFNSFKRKDKAGVLFILWLIIPIIRVSLPNTNIYGGDRQIMEFIPALALLTGASSFYLRDFIFTLIKGPNIFKNKLILTGLSIALIISFLPITLKLIQIHPNENVYFNSLIGGLKGAQQTNLPGWGNSFGSAYRQAFIWVNDHAPSGSFVGFAYELMPNFPDIFVRPDLNFDNHSRSGSGRWGEYSVTLTYQESVDRSYYDNYLERFLEPVYQAQVDGVSIVKVWKNDVAHTRSGYLKEVPIEVQVIKNSRGFTLDLGKVHHLSKVEAKFDNSDCQKLKSAFSQISEDGKSYKRLPGVMPKEDWNVATYGEQPKEDSFIEPFAADSARYIEYVIFPEKACFKNITDLKVYILPDLDT